MPGQTSINIEKYYACKSIEMETRSPDECILLTNSHAIEFYKTKKRSRYIEVLPEEILKRTSVELYRKDNPL